MDERDIIKKVDNDLRRFIGGTNQSIDEVFSDTARYRKYADIFWKKEITGKAKAA